MVIGDTKPIKDTLKQLGGSFNFRLSCGAGWIFSKKRLQEVKEALQPQKSPAASTVLQEMDAQPYPDYGQALAKALKEHPETDRQQLETELEKYI